MTRKGFITFEGCEGVGKSTQVRFLKEYLERTEQAALFTREPGGTPLAERIRSIILEEYMDTRTEAMLFAAARCDHIDHLILPALQEGKLVVCDRYTDSSLAYQGYGRGLGEKAVREINAYAYETCLPEVTVFLKMHPLHSWRRQKGKTVENDRMEQENDHFHAAVYQGFLALTEREPDRFIAIEPHLDKAVTSERIIHALRERGVIV